VFCTFLNGNFKSYIIYKDFFPLCMHHQSTILISQSAIYRQALSPCSNSLFRTQLLTCICIDRYIGVSEKYVWILTQYGNMLNNITLIYGTVHDDTPLTQNI
jgi:hypothetical protein